MKKKGRESAASISTLRVVRMGERPAPPVSLNIRAAEEWSRVADRMPSDWFTAETHFALQSHCEHVAEGEALQAMIETIRPHVMDDDEANKRYRGLLKDKAEQTRLALACATKMRLLQQNTYNALNGETAKKNAPKKAKPWQ